MGVIRTAIFDVDKCLYPPNSEIHEAHRTFFVGQVKQVLGLDDWAEAEQVLDAGSRDFGTNTLYLQYLQVGGGDIYQILKMQEECVWQERHNNLRKDERLRDMLCGLHQRGIRLFTLRNGTLQGTRMILNRLFGNYCDLPAGGAFHEREVASSAENLRQTVFPFEGHSPTVELGRLKPDPCVFLHLLETNRVDPSEAVMFGDMEHVDLRPAKQLGMKTGLVTWTPEPPAAGGCVDFVLPTIYAAEDIWC